VEWYETLGIENKDGKLDPCRVHTNEKTFSKINDVLLDHYAEKHNVSHDDGDLCVQVGMQLINIGPSGGHPDIPEDEFRVV
jgi:hypothetical protein